MPRTRIWRVSAALAMVMAVVAAAAGCAHHTAANRSGFSAPAKSAARQLDRMAARYVQLQLAIGKHEDGYIDAYYGPKAWATAAAADARDLPALRAAVAAERAALAGLSAPLAGDALQTRRLRFIDNMLAAADTRLRMMAGERLRFADEARGLFAVDVHPRPLSAFDPVLADIDRLVPGPGSLTDRVTALRNASNVPIARVRPFFEAAIAACRARTLAHIALPADESFTLELVTGKTWGGYNYYQGGYHSLIQLNTDQPARLSRGLDLGCHEGYPGHHVLNTLIEENLVKRRGWIEHTVQPLYSPQALLAEGSANYGVELAFPGAEKTAFETAILAPLAGIDPALARRNAALAALLDQLADVPTTIAQLYLDGEIDRARAIALTRQYSLVDAARAAKTIAFAEQYRSYVINYSLGQAMVRHYVERVGGSDAKKRWAAFAALLSQPVLPADLMP